MKKNKKKDLENKKFGVRLIVKEYIKKRRWHRMKLIDHFEVCIGATQLIETSGFFHENLKLYIEKNLSGKKENNGKKENAD